VRIGAALPHTRHVVSWADGRELYKTDELIELPFGGTDSFGSKEPLDGAHIPDGRYTFDGDMRRSIVKYKLRYCTKVHERTVAMRPFTKLLWPLGFITCAVRFVRRSFALLSPYRGPNDCNITIRIFSLRVHNS